MKKFLIIILSLLCLGCTGQMASAHGYGPGWGPPPPPPGHHRRAEASYVLEETRDYVLRANQIAYDWERNRLEVAFSNQRQARAFYQRGFYQRTISYSLRAREIAQDIIANHHRHHAPPPPPPPHRHHDQGSSIRIRLNL